MNTEQILKLLDAGFTAEEIRGFMPKAEDPKPEPVVKADPAKQEDPKPEPVVKADPAKQEDPKEADAVSEAINKAVSERFDSAAKSFEDLFTKMAKAAGVPSLADVTPKGIDDVITNFFKEV